eukprot:gb/GECG01005394.1/.p1 GENE.gb/GECG01005394.1/~~gb/GECG01005394.1/.p1  ORF type:complete len:451 (+),score=7.29 gb/GECG01005394.1/:1-1353(+)
MGSTTSGSFVAACTILMVVEALVAARVNYKVPEPYMDEIFHVNQTQRYCRGNFSYWDPKITTLPGTYWSAFLSLAALVSPFGRNASDATQATPQWCNLASLRAYNQAVLVICGIVTYATETRNAVWKSLAVVCLPWLFFYSQLFYTDTTGIAALLLTRYLASCSSETKRGKPLMYSILSAIVGAFAVFVRQTNVIWVAMIAAQYSLGELRRIFDRSSWNRKDLLRLVLKNIPYLFVGIGFFIFLCLNGGVAIGDQLHHKPAFHLAQIFYVSLFVCGPISISFALSGKEAWRYIHRRLNNRGIALIAVGFTLVMGTGVHSWKIIHPFLLADNRHISFYFFRKFVLQRPWILLGITPLASVFLVLVLELFEDRLVGWVWALTTMASLVPVPLFDFRYLIVPAVFALVFLDMSPKGYQLFIVASIFVNIATICLFTEWELPRQGNETTSRLMW